MLVSEAGIQILQLDILMYDRKRISGQIELPLRKIPISIQSADSR